MTTQPLQLLQLNIEYGGTGVDFAAVISVIEKSAASVVALQEGCGNVPEIASALGWPYFDVRTQVVSQLPLLDPPAATAGVILVEVEPGRMVAVINVHPASRGYGPIRLAKGESLPRVLRRERRLRVGELQPSLDAAADLMRDGLSVILLGDFNAPSHLDWTDDAVGILPSVTSAVAWPTSVALEAIGLVDAYRAVYPDPVSHPGLTWPADRPFVDGYNPAADGHPADRIDFMHVSPDVTVETISIVGETDYALSDLSVTPWPTDHRGLLASLQLVPGVPRPVVSVSSRLVTVGDNVAVRALAEGFASVSVVPIGDDAAKPLFEGAGDAGVWLIDTSVLGVGTFDVLAVGSANEVVARTRLWVAAVGAHPEVTTGRQLYPVGEPVDVRWSLAPGNRADWIAIYARGVSPELGKPMMKTVTGATIEGGVVFDAVLRPKKWPLPRGAYTVHLLMDDLPKSLASADFTVT